MVEKDVKLASIVRALKEKITPKRSRTGSAGCSRRRAWRRGCTASSPPRGTKRVHKGVDFIVRLKERYVRSWKRKWTCGELAWACRMRYREVVSFDHHGKEKRVTVEFGVVPVRPPDIPDRLLHMVVARRAIVFATIYFGMAWIGNSEKHEVVARSIARMSFRMHDVPEFHFYAIADGTSDILRRGRRWRGFDPAETEKEAEASPLAFFGLDTG